MCVCVRQLDRSIRKVKELCIFEHLAFATDSSRSNRSDGIAAAMGNHSSKKSQANKSIQADRSPLAATAPQTTNAYSDEVDDIPAAIQSPIQVPQTPLAESIAYHLTRLRQNNRFPEHSNLTQTPSILLRRRIASDLGFPRVRLDMAAPIDPWSPGVPFPRTPISLGDAIAATPCPPNKKVNRKLNVATPARTPAIAKGKRPIKPPTENERAAIGRDQVRKTAGHSKSVDSLADAPTKPKVPKRATAVVGGGAAQRSRSVESTHLTPKTVDAVRPKPANGRMPLSVINQPSDADEKTPVRAKLATPRPRSVSRIPVLKK